MKDGMVKRYVELQNEIVEISYKLNNGGYRDLVLFNKLCDDQQELKMIHRKVQKYLNDYYTSLTEDKA